MGTGQETDPHFSPDGQWVAFTAQYDGNTDVYVVPAAGGVPRRLTYHPGHRRGGGMDATTGSRSCSARPGTATRRSTGCSPCRVEGGFPTELPLPMATDGAFSPDGARLAYVPIFQWQAAWKRYRGGQTKPIWIANLADSQHPAEDPARELQRLPADVDRRQVYFLSDRERAGEPVLLRHSTAGR